MGGVDDSIIYLGNSMRKRICKYTDRTIRCSSLSHCDADAQLLYISIRNEHISSLPIVAFILDRRILIMRKMISWKDGSYEYAVEWIQHTLYDVLCIAPCPLK